MNLSSKNKKNTVYLEKVTVSHTKQFFGNTRPETKKITTLKVIVPGQLEALASSWFLIRDLAAKSMCEACEKRSCYKGRVWSYCSAVIQ